MKRNLFTAGRSLFGVCTVGTMLLTIGCMRQESAPLAVDGPPSLSLGPAPEYIAIVRPGEIGNITTIAQNNGFSIVDLDLTGEIVRYSTHGSPHAEQFEVYQPNGPVIHYGPISGMVWVVGSEDAGEDQTALECMRLPDCHTAATGDEIRVALLDTGVDHRHPLLADNVVMIDHPVLGYPSVDTGGVSWWHGTAMAGLIVTVSPQVAVYPYKVIDRTGTGTDFELSVAIRAATLDGADLMNFSVATSTYSPVVDRLLQEAVDVGIIVVAAAGNNTHQNTAAFPASSQHTVGVSGLKGGEFCNEIDSYSAHGVDIDFAAVGTGVVSAHPGGLYAASTGTSNAAALTTGAIAAILDQLEPPDPYTALAQLRVTAGQVSSGGVVESGVIDLATALGQ